MKKSKLMSKLPALTTNIKHSSSVTQPETHKHEAILINNSQNIGKNHTPRILTASNPQQNHINSLHGFINY